MVYLIDINVMLALAWPNHPHHQAAIRWMDARDPREGWATCATIQLGFVRISSQPKFSSHHVTPGAATDMLARWIADPRHVYWQEEQAGLTGSAFQRLLPTILTHRFVTDGFLVSVASANDGKLATFDRPLAKLFGDRVEIIAQP